MGENRMPEGREGQPAGREPASLNWLVGLALVVLGVLFLIGQFFQMADMFWSLALVGVGMTFLAVYLTDRARWWALIPAYIFSVTGAFILIQPLLWGEGDAIYWLAAVGLPFLVTFLVSPRRNWWALIPAYLFGSVAAFLMVERLLPGDWDAIYWLAVVGAPFLITAITNLSKRWWALIPAYVFGTAGTFLLLERMLNDELIAAYWLFAIAAPFFIVLVINPRRNWWALIPGGILAAIGFGLTVAAIEYLIPAIMLVAGIYLLLRYMRGAGSAPERPRRGPEADLEPPSQHREGPDSGPEADHG